VDPGLRFAVPKGNRRVRRADTQGVRPSEILARWREEHITQKPPSTGFVRITLGIFRVIGYGLSDLITSSPFPFMEMWVMSFASTGIFIITDPQNESGCRRKS